ncbi:hypothetical protein, partial [Citrobacter cronae]|uniref:hypothetical protein n=1 Tax=Citrobacter cronae TaxID=1748967 RepID=UPI00195DFDE8
CFNMEHIEIAMFLIETPPTAIFFCIPVCKITLSAASGRRSVVQTDTLHQMAAEFWQHPGLSAEHK